VADRQHRNGDTGLHIEDAGTVQASVTLAYRHGCKRSGRPHRIEMSEQQDLRGARAAEFGANVITAQRLRIALDRRADPRRAGARVPRPHTFHRQLVVARRLEPDEALEKLTKPGLFGLAIGQEIGHRKTRRTGAASL
jgi:hypothetical protein